MDLEAFNVTDLSFPEFWALIENSSVMQIEEMEAKIAFEANFLAGLSQRSFVNMDLVSESGKDAFKTYLSSYGLQLNLQYKSDICKHFKHEKMPDCFKNN